MKREQHEVFFDMEQKYNLFQIKTTEGFPVWDILRYLVFYNVIFFDYNVKEIKELKTTKREIFNKAYCALRSLVTFFPVLFNKYQNFRFAASRTKNAQGKHFDPNYDILKDIVPGRFMIYESVIDKSQYSDDIRVFDILPALKKILFRLPGYRKKNRILNATDFGAISTAIKGTFGTDVISAAELEHIVNEFRLEYRFYKWFLKFKNIQRVFITQNGVQKALCHAAKYHSIPTFEFQHGDIVDGTLLYNYGEHLSENKQNIIFPDVLFVYTDIWAKGKFIPSKCVEVGMVTSQKIINKLTKTNNNIITVITSNEQNGPLQKLVSKLAAKDDSITYLYKLHPAQFHKKKEQEKFFENFSNVKVISSEKTIADIIDVSDMFLAIYSTAIYEILQAGKFVFIYKRLNYWFIKSYLNLENIYLIDDAQDLLKYYRLLKDKPLSKHIPQFFKPFNKEVFLSTIEKSYRDLCS